ncbi:MAG TPA: hypothetical protein VN280_00460 [Variovorax sp.]|nr:hypothetical protein [Variovorax sp.]
MADSSIQKGDPDRKKAVAKGDWSYCTSDAMKRSLGKAASRFIAKGVRPQIAIDILMDVAIDLDAEHMETESERAVAVHRAVPHSTFRLVDTFFMVAPLQDAWSLVEAATVHLTQSATVIEDYAASLPSAKNKDALTLFCAVNAMKLAHALIERALEVAPAEAASK